MGGAFRINALRIASFFRHATGDRGHAPAPEEKEVSQMTVVVLRAPEPITSAWRTSVEQLIRAGQAH
jgi:hypothetical protein